MIYLILHVIALNSTEFSLLVAALASLQPPALGQRQAEGQGHGNREEDQRAAAEREPQTEGHASRQKERSAPPIRRRHPLPIHRYAFALSRDGTAVGWMWVFWHFSFWT